MISLGTLGATTRRGLALATLMLMGWLITLISLLSLRVADWSVWLIAGAVVLRTVLQTGLFITAHDAMHGVLLPECRRWNHRLGIVFLLLYAALPYRRCRRNHQWHHNHTATVHDPDFHEDQAAGPLRWYRRFMAGYLSQNQMLRLLGFWGSLVLISSHWNTSAWLNLLLFCTLPLLLSSLQLFVFGTYLPHRCQRQQGSNQRPESLDHPPWLSLLTCFHFGYHREHHDHPQLAWFQLPSMRHQIKPLTSGLTTRVASSEA